MARRRRNPRQRLAVRALLVTAGGAAIVLAAWLQLGSCTRPVYMNVPPDVPPGHPEGWIPPATPAEAQPSEAKPAAANARSAVGYNLDFPGDWTWLPPFIDLMKNARPWAGGCEGSGDRHCDGVSQLSLDEHGWVRSLRYKDHPEHAYAYVETVVLTFKGQPGLDGDLWVTYEGQGEIELLGAEVTGRDPAQRRITFRAQPGSVFLRITASDPNGSGNYLKNIRVFRADQADALQKGGLFNPDMLAYLAPFGSLRFMDWMEGNQQGLCSGGAKHGQDCYVDLKGRGCPAGRCVMAGVWSERPRMDQPSLLSRSQLLDPKQPGHGVRVGGYPVEMLVALANALGADPHFNLPALYTDDYVREFAGYVAKHLAPNLRASVEYSNETWNWGFPQANYVNIKGRQLWPQEGSAWIQYSGSRMQHLCRLWKEVFREHPERVRCLISPQTGWPGMAQNMLDCPAWASDHPDLGPCHQGADAIAITGYFSGCLQEKQNEPKLREWLGRGKEYALDQFFAQLEQGRLLRCADEEVKNSLVDALRLYDKFAFMARARSLDLYVYESGTHFDYEGKDPNVERLFVDAVHDERMAQLYRRNLEGFKEAGGTIINAWGWIGPNDSWANADNVKDRSHPKYRALRDFAQGEPCWWEHCDRSQR
ncbi:MAG: hypothetical protein ABI895_08565 [Deltaproteobacteria bacterium]